jgi:L-ascorbate metabolism protein UlaG (beta-lactamase superfamily)
VVLNAAAAQEFHGGLVMENGDVTTLGGVQIEAVPAYNLVHRRNNGEPFHPRGEGNGYVITLGGLRVYVAGDTENTPEMKALPRIDVAFLPMNVPYTMAPEMVADAASALRPRVLYPYHLGETDTAPLVALMKDVEGVELRLRRMK